MQYIYPLIKAYKRQFVLMSIISVISGGSGALFLGLINYSVTIQGQANRYLIYGFIITIVIILASQYVHKRYFSKISNKIVKQLRVDLSDKILASSLRCKEQCGEAELLALLTQDIQSLSMFLNNLPLLLSSTVLVFAIVIYISWVSGLIVSLLILSFFCAGIIAMLLVLAKLKPLFERLRQHEATLLSHFRDLIIGFKELKMNAKQDLLGEHINPEVVDLMELTVTAEVKEVVAGNWAYGSIYVLITALIFVYPLWVSLPPEAILSNVLSIIYLITPIQTIMMTFPLLMKANIAAHRIAQVELEMKLETESPLRNRMVPQPLSHIELTNLCFSYIEADTKQSEEKKYIGPFHLRINKQEIVFIAGGNGSGKSTLIKLLCGLYKPEKGQIIWNGEILEEYKLAEYREQFSTVFSDFHLYNAVDLYHIETLLDNDFAKHWGQQALLSDFGLENIIVLGRPLSVEALSSGQKKRLAILIAVLQPKPICLFDEPAAELDPDFKHYFYTELLGKLRAGGKTIIVVTHDDNYFKEADRLIQLRDGIIIKDA